MSINIREIMKSSVDEKDNKPAITIPSEALTIKVKYFDPDMPRLDFIGGMNNSNWVDLYCAEEMHIGPGEYKAIPLGVAIQLPPGYEAYTVPRSSTFKRYGIIQTNSMGVIDNSYCGDDDQWHMLVYSLNKGNVIIPKYSRICQFRINKIQPRLVFEEVESLGNPNRGGVGSTGK